MKRTLIIILLVFVAHCAAQTDVCWRDAYPSLPGQWSDYGYIVEAGNRFKPVAGATIELWSTTSDFDDAHQRATDHRSLPATLIKTTSSMANGYFSFKEIQPGSYEIRVHMAGRESSSAYTAQGDHPGMQWMGRGLRIALSKQGKGCSRIYSAGLDETDCGLLDCEGLPVGRTKIMFSDGSPLSVSKLFFYRDVRGRKPDNPDFTLATDSDGFVNTAPATGCYDVHIQRGKSMHLCFKRATAQNEVTISLPPIKNPLQ